jgi:hypothetical protein
MTSSSVAITLIETPLALLRSTSGENHNAFRTNYPKIPQLMIAGLLRTRLPDLGIIPEIRIIDMKGRDPKKTEIYGEVRYGDTQLHKLRIGMSFEDVRGHLVESDIIGLTANFTQEANVIRDFIRFAKSTSDTKIIVGGSDAIARPTHYLSAGADVVIQGEGEIAGPKVIEVLINGGDLRAIDGIAYAVDGSVTNQGQPISPVSMEDVAYPALDLARLDEYYEDHEGTLPADVRLPLMYLETSRGCKMVCTFCTTPYLRKGYRYMSTARIQQWLVYYRRFGISTILLSEDNLLSRLHFPGGREEILEIFQILRAYDFAWEFINGFEIGKLADVNGVIDYELIEAMFSSCVRGDRLIGCFRSYIPVESLRDDAPKKYKKLRTWDIEKEILRAIADAGLPALGFGIMIGFVDDTPETLKLTAQRCTELRELCEKANPAAIQHFQFFNNILLPGTPNFSKHLKYAKYDISAHPELFNFYTSIVDGHHFEHSEYYRERQNLTAILNGDHAQRNWVETGKYY